MSNRRMLNSRRLTGVIGSFSRSTDDIAAWTFLRERLLDGSIAERSSSADDPRCTLARCEAPGAYVNGMSMWKRKRGDEQVGR